MEIQHIDCTLNCKTAQAQVFLWNVLCNGEWDALQEQDNSILACYSSPILADVCPLMLEIHLCENTVMECCTISIESTCPSGDHMMTSLMEKILCDIEEKLYTQQIRYMQGNVIELGRIATAGYQEFPAAAGM